MRIVPLLAAAGLLVCIRTASAEPVLPDFSAAIFVNGAPITNAYFPVVHGLTHAYQGSRVEDGETITERFELTGFGTGPTLLGVQTTTLRDREFEDGVIQEDTFDYFAQDTAGNVWYFGEDVTNYRYDEDGNLIGTDTSSSWRAGVNGALPGFIMPVDQTLGFNYYQEFAPADEAIDTATTFANGQMLTIALGVFDEVLTVLETNPLDPDSREFKHYAPGIGLLAADEGLGPDLTDPEIRLELVSISQVAEPASLGLLLLGAVGLTLGQRLRARGAGDVK